SGGFDEFAVDPHSGDVARGAHGEDRGQGIGIVAGMPDADVERLAGDRLDEHGVEALAHDRSPTSSRASASAPAEVARCSRCAESSATPPVGSSCCMKYDWTPSLSRLKPVPAPTSEPSATRTPASRWRRRGKN